MVFTTPFFVREITYWALSFIAKTWSNIGQLRGIMMQYPYTILDVFTKERLQGNPLAVVHDADHLSDEQMQAIAKEFNLSETVFIHKPKIDRHMAELRIFTPAEELPFAGHPTVGAAVLLGLRLRSSAIRLEEKVGTIVAITEKTSKSSGHARFAVPKLAERVADAPSPDQIARSLGLQEEEIGCAGLEPAVYSAGVPFVCVPVRDVDALSRIRLERRGWREVFTGMSKQVYVFTEARDEVGVNFASRAFVELGGIKEDPATGSAAAALCGLLADEYFSEDGLFDLVIRQGADMGRRSYIEAQIKLEEGRLTHAGIGGHAIVLAEGTLNLD